MASLSTALRTASGWLNLQSGTTYVPAPSAWTSIYSTNFSVDDGWTIKQETQSNDNSYNHPDNVEFGSRGLVIAGRREERGGRPFTTGDVLGRHITVPNYFAATCTVTLPTDYGMWPGALWFRPLNSPHGEVDMCETWTYDWPPARLWVSVHQDYSQTPRHVTAPLDYSMLPNPDPAAPHTYTVEKTPGRINFAVDGVRAYCWERGAKWSGTLRIGPLPDWWDLHMEDPDKTWYPRACLQLGGPETPDPLPEWSESESIIHSMELYSWNGAAA